MPLRMRHFLPFPTVSWFDRGAISSSRPAARLGRRPQTRAGKHRLLTIADLDARTAAKREAVTLVDALTADLGGAEALNTAKRKLVERAALTSALLEDLCARWLPEHGFHRPPAGDRSPGPWRRARSGELLSSKLAAPNRAPPAPDVRPPPGVSAEIQQCFPMFHRSSELQG